VFQFLMHFQDMSKEGVLRNKQIVLHISVDVRFLCLLFFIMNAVHENTWIETIPVFRSLWKSKGICPATHLFYHCCLLYC
jgi:hypothetical protein